MTDGPDTAIPARVLEPLLDAETLAEHLGVSRRWIYTQCAEHGMPHRRFGKSLSFSASAVQSWLDTRRAGDWPEDCGPPISADSIFGDMRESSGG